MASDKKTKDLALVQEPTTDFSDIDLKKIEDYKEAGLPGLYAVTPVELARMWELYLSGKPYLQLSRIMKLDKALIMYMSQKFNWYTARREYQHEVESTIRNRVIQDKVDNQDFLLKLTHFYKKKLGKKIDSYISTDDESHANAIDGKEILQAIKTIESLEKLTSEEALKKPKAPAVGLNVGDGVTMTKNEDGSVDITPKQKSTSDMIKQFAEEQRAAERNKNKI